MIAAESCRHVSRKADTPGGTVAATREIRDSSITPGPLGILETRPTAEAPAATAMDASSRLLIQQILIRTFIATTQHALSNHSSSTALYSGNHNTTPHICAHPFNLWQRRCPTCILVGLGGLRGRQSPALRRIPPTPSKASALSETTASSSRFQRNGYLMRGEARA